MVVGSCDIVSELLRRGLENLVVKILSNTDINTVTACLLVNSFWSSNLRDIWRLLLREKKKSQPSFRYKEGLVCSYTLNTIIYVPGISVV